MLPAASVEVLFMRVCKRASGAHSDDAAMDLQISLGATPLAPGHAGENCIWARGTSMRQPLQYRYPLPR